MQKSKSVLENEVHHILWVIEIQTECIFAGRRTDLVQIPKNIVLKVIEIQKNRVHIRGKENRSSTNSEKYCPQEDFMSQQITE